MADQSWGNRMRHPFGGTVGAKMAAFNTRLQSSAMGRAFYGGAMESLGFYTPGMTTQSPGSFMGVRETMDELGGRRGQAFSKLVKDGRYKNAARYAKGRISRVGMKGAAGWGAKFAGSTVMKSIPLISTAAMAYSGYQEGGVMGALGGVGESMMWSAGMRMAATALGTLAYAAPVAAVGAGVYAMGEVGRAHAKGLRTLEMGGPQIQEALGSAGAATMRQRSLMALNNTHLNGRMAMGNEAALMHDGAISTGLGGRY